jgi:hypothetical protein
MRERLKAVIRPSALSEIRNTEQDDVRQPVRMREPATLGTDEI